MHDRDKRCSFFATRSLPCVSVHTAKPNLHGLHPFNPSFASHFFVCRLRMWRVGLALSFASGSVRSKHLRLHGSFLGRLKKYGKSIWQLSSHEKQHKTTGVLVKLLYYGTLWYLPVIYNDAASTMLPRYYSLRSNLKFSYMIYVCLSCGRLKWKTLSIL